MTLLSLTLTLAAEGGANPFAGRIYQAIAAATVFLVIFFVLKKKAWGPILTGLQARENKIKGDLESAEKANEEAASTLNAYREQLSQAQAEARRIIDQGRLDASKIAAQLKADAESEIRGIKERAERDIKAAKEQALTEIYSQTATLATTVASRILRREIKPADQEQLVQESLAELGKTRRN